MRFNPKRIAVVTMFCYGNCGYEDMIPKNESSSINWKQQLSLGDIRELFTKVIEEVK